MLRVTSTVEKEGTGASCRFVPRVCRTLAGLSLLYIDGCGEGGASNLEATLWLGLWAFKGSHLFGGHSRLFLGLLKLMFNS